jgi:hypothetical protein
MNFSLIVDKFVTHDLFFANTDLLVPFWVGDEFAVNFGGLKRFEIGGIAVVGVILLPKFPKVSIIGVKGGGGGDSVDFRRSFNFALLLLKGSKTGGSKWWSSGIFLTSASSSA